MQQYTSIINYRGKNRYFPNKGSYSIDYIGNYGKYIDVMYK